MKIGERLKSTSGWDEEVSADTVDVTEGSCAIVYITKHDIQEFMPPRFDVETRYVSLRTISLVCSPSLREESLKSDQQPDINFD